jgi:transcriptional regulator with XRE-family HTH domain
MGHSRPRPKHLAKKVLQIRRSLGISQGEMVKRLGVQELIDNTTISKYELDKNEPPLAILLAYARVVEFPSNKSSMTNWISQSDFRKSTAIVPTPINVPNTSRHGRVPC